VLNPRKALGRKRAGGGQGRAETWLGDRSRRGAPLFRALVVARGFWGVWTWDEIHHQGRPTKKSPSVVCAKDGLTVNEINSVGGQFWRIGDGAGRGALEARSQGRGGDAVKKPNGLRSFREIPDGNKDKVGR